MRRAVFFFLFGVVLPIVTSLVTYTLVTLESDPLNLDETGALILTIALIKIIILGGTGVFPIDINKLFDNIVTRGKRSTISSGVIYDNNTLYQVPEVVRMPCIRRLLCHMEMAARTSENYLPKEPAVIEGRNLEEEVAPEPADPITELQIEAVRALFKEEDPTGELSPRGNRALRVIEGLTGEACEAAYNLCPGRFTIPGLYRTLFDEMNFAVHEFY
ncbi:hypothetical protein C7M84_013989 [Penaeus vannamei]|uniref:Uncharacterized protein n=1 Tax=Penaeus vannamei TaxID=6689 RepID=A0A3R7M002_PENVA|nr:uncharacterized protein LOC113816933 isoform X1 [Penaeus vannamei]ROT67896.1 hypothetical protein C7M84_013989 [Penaeus vannamei]